MSKTGPSFKVTERNRSTARMLLLKFPSMARIAAEEAMKLDWEVWAALADASPKSLTALPAELALFLNWRILALDESIAVNSSAVPAVKFSLIVETVLAI